jgi:hypothetical protein
MPQNVIDEIVAASPNRPRFLKQSPPQPRVSVHFPWRDSVLPEAQTSTEVEVLKFALNLEYVGHPGFVASKVGMRTSAFPELLGLLYLCEDSPYGGRDPFEHDARVVDECLRVV